MVNLDFLRQRMPSFLVEHGLAFVAMADVASCETAYIGNPESLPYQQIVQRLTGGVAALRNLHASLDGRLLPQVWSQGQVKCYATRLGTSIVVALFEAKAGPPEAIYHRSKQLEAALASMVETGAAS